MTENARTEETQVGGETTAVTVIPAAPANAELQRFMPVMDIEQGLARRDILVKAFKSLLKDSEDFGTIPGSKKPTLLQPGAQKLDNLFGLVARFEVVDKVEDWTGKDHGGEPFFRYMVRCYVMRGDFIMGEGVADCNSWESKYRYRWMNEEQAKEHQGDALTRLPKRGGRRVIFEPQFALNKSETTGQYGKPAAYWERWKAAIASGTAREAQKEMGKGTKRRMHDGYEMEIDELVYRVPNPDVFDQVNTILKISEKRAHILATINATSASEFVTQDLEDIKRSGEEQSAEGIDTGGHAVGTKEASDYVRDKKLKEGAQQEAGEDRSAGKTQTAGEPPSPAAEFDIPEELQLPIANIRKDSKEISKLYATLEKNIVAEYSKQARGEDGLRIYRDAVMDWRERHPKVAGQVITIESHIELILTLWKLIKAIEAENAEKVTTDDLPQNIADAPHGHAEDQVNRGDK